MYSRHLRKRFGLPAQKKNIFLTSNSANLETSTNLCRQFSLCSTQHNVQKLLLGRHRRDILPRRLHLGQSVTFREGTVLWWKSLDSMGCRVLRMADANHLYVRRSNNFFSSHTSGWSRGKTGSIDKIGPYSRGGKYCFAYVLVARYFRLSPTPRGPQTPPENFRLSQLGK